MAQETIILLHIVLQKRILLGVSFAIFWGNHNQAYLTSQGWEYYNVACLFSNKS